MLQLAAPLLVLCLPTPELQLGEFGDWNGARFGRAVLALADIDGDGVRDLAVGAPTARGHAGRVLVLSGATREVLQVWQGEGGRPTFGHTLCALGDVDGDGRQADLVGRRRPLGRSLVRAKRAEVTSCPDVELALGWRS